MHKRTIPLAISTIMLALVVSVPVDTAGQERGPRERAGLRQRQQQQRGRSPRASTPRDSNRRGSFRQGFGQRGSGWLGFGRGGFRSQFNFNFGLGTSQYGYTPQYYPPYSWERMPYNGGCRRWDELTSTIVYRGGRYMREYFCLNPGNIYYPIID